MKFYAALFRYRSWILTVLVILGFVAPWQRIHGARPGSTWLYLAGILARHGIFSIAGASIAVMAVAILLAVLAALLRTWAAAYFGRGVVEDRALHSDAVVADGPYRFVRNPLYLGTWLNILALTILMPTGGAIFAILTSVAFNAALVRAEERNLRAVSGEMYAAYARKVPRWIPAMTPRVAAGKMQAKWLSGLVGELYFWGAAITYIAFASRYNVTILEQGVLVSLGVGIVVQGIWRPRPAAEPGSETAGS
jgi:protein-S-isoprenylcysteine O-methyltransferase Ste14